MVSNAAAQPAQQKRCSAGVGKPQCRHGAGAGVAVKAADAAPPVIE
jgi:hypothetical protein